VSEREERGGKSLLDPSELLGEVLFGLIMTLTFTLGSGLTAAEGPEGVRQLLVAALGCNVAWGLIDGVLCVMGRLWDRDRRRRLHHRLRAEPSPAAAAAIVRSELDETLAPLAGEAARERLYAEVLVRLRESEPVPGGLRREDLYAGLATFALVFGATLPAVAPFLVMSDKLLSLRASNAVLLAMLFGTGWLWAGWIGASRLGTATAMTAIGLVLVVAAIALGG
jgi:hypothetical protein